MCSVSAGPPLGQTMGQTGFSMAGGMMSPSGNMSNLQLASPGALAAQSIAPNALASVPKSLSQDAIKPRTPQTPLTPVMSPSPPTLGLKIKEERNVHYGSKGGDVSSIQSKSDALLYKVISQSKVLFRSASGKPLLTGTFKQAATKPSVSSADKVSFSVSIKQF